MAAKQPVVVACDSVFSIVTIRIETANSVSKNEPISYAPAGRDANQGAWMRTFGIWPVVFPAF